MWNAPIPEGSRFMDVEQLVMEAQAGDVEAFTELVRRYQAMAFGYAYANLGDFHAAEDVTQGAFLAAWRNISKLHQAERFGGWLRGIVRFECSHTLRKRHVPQVPIDGAGEIASTSPGPADVVEEREARDRILRSILALPQTEREVTVLFHIENHSQRDVAAFLNLPVTTVNNRLRSARKHLKEERLHTMAKDALHQHGLSGDFAERIGEIVRAEGSIIDARFPADRLPGILNAITVGDDASGSVTQHLDNGLVRGIVKGKSTPRPGMRVTDTASPVSTPLDHGSIAQLIASLGPTDSTPVLLETGIKAVDLCCPLPIGGVVGLVGDMQSGKTVLVEELIHRLAESTAHLTMLVFIETAKEVPVVRQLEYRTSAAVEVIYLPVTDATPEALDPLIAPLDAVIAITRERAREGLYPAIDPLRSTSRLLDPAVVGQEHVDVVQRVRQALAAGANSATGQTALHRARLIERFLTQPFYIAEAFTNRPGSSVSREQVIAGCRALLEGEHDDLAEDALYMTGTLNEALANR